MENASPPLSSTVASVFAAFLKRLEEDGNIAEAPIEALRKTLEQQKLDPDSLRKALFAQNGADK